MPTVSVVINTFNGGDGLLRAIDSVLAQDLDDVEVVVADDGSDPSAAVVVASARPDAAIRVVDQPNAGLGAARNLGIANTTGDFVLFLDDDDELIPGGLAHLCALIGPSTGVVSGTALVVYDDAGHAPKRVLPRDHGADLDHQVVCNLAGSWLMARTVMQAIGGFDPEIRCNHQRELFLRAVPWCLNNGWDVLSTTEDIARIHRKSPFERPRNDPARLRECLERTVAKHDARLRRNPAAYSALHASIGVAAARLGDLRATRRHLFCAWRMTPRDVKTFGRLLVASCPPLARRVWSAHQRAAS